jgi:integrase
MSEKRRDKGDGSIYQRGDGYWVAKYTPTPNAKPKVLYGKTEQEAKRKLREFKKEVAKNDYVEVQRITVKQYMDRWFKEIKMQELKPTSIDGLEATLNNQIYPNIGDIQINSLTADDIQALIYKLATEPYRANPAKCYSYSTIKKAYDAINACFELGVIKKNVSVNPCKGVKLPKNKERKNSEIHFFTEDEVDNLCKECISKHGNGMPVYRLGYAVILLLNTGMRIGELLGLKWADVDLENRTAKVYESVVVAKDRDRAENDTSKPKWKQLEQDDVKTAASERFVALNDEAIEALRQIHAINGRHEHVMSTAPGRIMYHRNFYRMMCQICARCGIKQCGAHTLRHTFASMLFKAGVDVKTVSELLGHSDVSITYNIYIHLINEQKQQAVDILSEVNKLRVLEKNEAAENSDAL